MEEIEEKSHVLKDELSALLGGDTVRKKTVWLGRVGYGGPKQARSIRRPLSEITQ